MSADVSDLVDELIERLRVWAPHDTELIEALDVVGMRVMEIERERMCDADE